MFLISILKSRPVKKMEYSTDYPEIHLQLWWEYLRRSKKYQELCDWYREDRESMTFAPVPVKFLDITNTFRDNGDVHRLTFEQWMPWKIKKITEKAGRYKKEIFTEYKNFVMRDIQFTISNMKKILDRDPSLDEFLDFFSCRGFEPGFYVLNPFGVNPKTAVQEIKDFLEDSAKHRKAGLRYDDLKTYLKVYDLTEDGKTIHEIILNFYPDYDPSPSLNLPVEIYDKELSKRESQQRVFYRYREKAEKIIKNTEQGFFPGQY
jgi:hypothetical protein